MISLNEGSSRGSDAKMKKRKNDCLQNEVQDAKENHAVEEKKKYERKPSQPYCSTCGGNHFEACKGRFCRNCHSHHFDSCPEGSSRGSDAKMKKRKNNCLQNEVQDAKENHAVGEKKKYERKSSQPYCSTCGGNHFKACKGRFCLYFE